jgi:cytidylate kinase
LKSHGEPADVDEIERAIRTRDRLDMSREVGALKKAVDAIEVDSTHLTIQQAVDAVVKLAQERLAGIGG